MALAAALMDWIIVGLWLGVLCVVGLACRRSDCMFGTTRLLLVVVAIEVVRNLAESAYFGLFLGAQHGVLPETLGAAVARPELLIPPKALNILAAALVLGLLVWRWLPMMARERRDSEYALLLQSDVLQREIEEQRLLFEMSVDLIMILDRKGVIRRISESVKSVLGYDPDELVDRDGATFADLSDVARVRRVVAELPNRGVVEGFTAQLRHRDGRSVVVTFSGVWAKDLDCALVIGRDVTEQLHAAEELDRLAHFDALSGLPNRASLLRDLAEELERENGADPALGVAVFDLDGFKDVNDLMGHSTGDRVVQEVGARMLALSVPGCRLYRSGGDEFFVLMSGINDPALVKETVGAVIAALEERVDVDGYQLFVTVSAGIAVAPEHGRQIDDLILNADLALHQARSDGGHKVSLFEPSMRTRARARQEIENELRRAVAEGELVLYYQPQVRLRDRKVVGAEALLRWNHPERGLLAPAAFIDALSRSAAAVEAGHFVLRSACAAAAGWRAKGLGGLRVGVNLFPIQFHSRTLVADVAAAIAASGVETSQLELEITENIALGHDAEVLETLNGLRALGVGIAFDDFGTGYASLSYLMRYPLTRLKIDRSFVQKIAEGAQTEDTAIVQSIVVMAHNIGLNVVAEGVETEAQAAFLKARRCEEAQGYLFAKPLPVADFEAFVLAGGAGVPFCTNGAA